MGLSSSQARLLNLTARMHQIEYKAAKLEAQKLQMANESRRVYDEYLDALEQTKVQVKTLNNDGSASYKDINSFADFTDAGYGLLDVKNKSNLYNGYININDIMTAEDHGISDADAAELVSKITTGDNYAPQISFKTLCSRALGTNYYDVDNLNVEQVITNLINSGEFVIVRLKDNSETSVAIDTGLQEVSDETLLRKAEAKYEADMRKIDAKDRKYDTDLAALEAERNAIKSEMETLKTVAKDNVERTFKLFS